ncbi:hypothetical protein HXY33_08380 [Candidatus Bathyarchaeota archaeon]|nr:hypothetical protein [Candidatus Bathyarchaeota archaeon]
MSLSELLRTLGDIAEIAITIMLAYVVFKIAVFLETLNRKVKEEKI